MTAMPGSGPRSELLSAMPLPTETPQPPWLLSFCDFVSCLLACFVLLYSLVAVDQSKLDKILEGVPGRHVAQAIPPSAVKRAMAVAPQEEGRNADYLASLLQAKLGHDPALAHVAVEGQGDRVLLHLSADDLLASTQPNQPAGQALVFALGGALGTLPDRIAVEVRPDNAAQFDASLSYAVRLAHRLEQAGLSGPIAARTRLTAPAEAAGVDLIVFDTGPDASGP